MKTFIEYLANNLIKYELIGDLIYIDGKSYRLLKNTQQPILTKDFKLQNRNTDSDYTIINLANIYFRLHANQDHTAHFEEIRWIGQAIDQSTKTFLGIHSNMEILNGIGSYDEWCQKAKFLGIKSLGICELNSLRGLFKFQKSCEKYGILPVLGMTMIAKNNDICYRLKAYIKNSTGYKNLLKINEQINCINNGFIQEDKLLTFTDGLIFVIETNSLQYKYATPILNLTSYFTFDILDFANDNMYNQSINNLRNYLKDRKFQPTSINDAYFIDANDKIVHDSANLIADNFYDVGSNQYLKTKNQYFKEIENSISVRKDSILLFNSAIANEQMIADQCQFTISTKQKFLPQYKMTTEEKKQYQSENVLFDNIIQKNFKLKIHNVDTDEYEKRLKYESDLIKQGNLINYFLISYDIVNYSIKNNILTGFGRGSVGGSLIAYLLNIIHADPIKHDLYFERFLTPSRIKKSLPDIDMDFPAESRDKIQNYITNKYDKEHVCFVGTINLLAFNGLIKALYKEFNLTAKQANLITKNLDQYKSDTNSIIRAVLESPAFRKLAQIPTFLKKFIRLIQSPSHKSIHASAMIIIPENLTITETIPVRLNNKNGNKIYVSEFDGVTLDECGYLKEDFLVIKTLDQLSFIINQYHKITGNKIDIYNLPINERKTIEAFKSGLTANIFQFKSILQKLYLLKLQPETIEDLTIATALIRPGARNNLYDELFVKLRKSPEKIHYLRGLEEITKSTCGLLVFQEQIIAAFNKIGNLTLEEGEEVRKALSKKKSDIINEYKVKFINGAQKNQYNKTEATNLWSKIEHAVEYQFNKSHATSYTYMSYFQMYLKVHYPIYFFAATFNDKELKDDDLAMVIHEVLQNKKINIRICDINKPNETIKCNYEENIIYWPLSKVINCGISNIKKIKVEYELNGPYQSYDDFIVRIRTKDSFFSKKAVKYLILAGAFDNIEKINETKERFRLLQWDKKNHCAFSNENWFYQLQQRKACALGIVNHFELMESIGWENKAIYKSALEIQKSKNLTKVTVIGYVLSATKKSSKNGNFIAVNLDCNHYILYITIWPETYQKYKSILNNIDHQLLIMTGKIKFDDYHKQNSVYSMKDSIVQIIKI